MDYNSLKYIIVVDKHQSISKAAEELYLTQPNISKVIQNMEKEIGFKIFTRTSRGVATTPEGKDFIKKSIKIVGAFDEFIKEFTNKESKLYNMNIAHPKDIYFQSKVVEIAEHFKNNKDINVNILEGTTEEIIDMLLKETVNLGVICVNEHDLAYYKKLLFLNNLGYEIRKPLKLTATFHNTNPLSKFDTVNKNILATQTLITTNNDYYKFYNEKYQIVLSTNVVKLGVNLNQIHLLSKIENSYLLSLPLPEELLKIFNCKSAFLDFEVGDWIPMILYKNTSTLTELEKTLITLI